MGHRKPTETHLLSVTYTRTMNTVFIGSWRSYYCVWIDAVTVNGESLIRVRHGVKEGALFAAYQGYSVAYSGALIQSAYDSAVDVCSALAADGWRRQRGELTLELLVTKIKNAGL